MNSKTQVVPKVSDKKLYIYITIIKPLLFFFPFEEKPFTHSNGCSLLWVYVFQNLKFLLLNAYKRLKKKKKTAPSYVANKRASQNFISCLIFKKIILCGFSSVNQPYSLVRTHNTKDLLVKSIPCFTLRSFLYQSSSFHWKLYPSLF